MILIMNKKIIVFYLCKKYILCTIKKYLLKISEMVKSYMKIKYVLYNYPIGYKDRGEV